MSVKGQVLAGVKWTTISTIVLVIAALLKISILTRFLNKADFGLMALITFVIGFMELFNDMGLTSAIFHKQIISKEEYASLYWLNLFFSVCMFGVLYLVSPFIALFYDLPELNTLIPLIGISLIFSGLGKQFKAIETKNMRFKQVSIIDMISSLISLVVAVVLAIYNYGILSLAYSILLQFAISNLLYLFLGLKNYGLLVHFSFYETKPFLRIGVYQVGGQVINYFNRDLDILLIGKFFPADILGGYSLARELVRRPIALIHPIVSKVGGSALANFNHDKNLLKQYYLKLVNTVSSLSIPIYLFIAIFAGLIVDVIYGSEYESIVLIVRILCVSMVFRVVGGVVGNLVLATGRTDLDFKWNLLNILVTPIFVIVGAQLSITWVAIMVSLSSILFYIPSWRFYISQLLDVSLKEYSKAFFIINKIKF